MKSLVLLGIGSGLGVTAIVTGLMRHAAGWPSRSDAVGNPGVAGAGRSWALEAPAALQLREPPAPGPERARSI